MQGRTSTGIVCIFGNCADPAKEAELNDWYVDMHIPDVTRPGIFPLCTRFENAKAAGGDDSPKLLAIYETTRDDPAAAWAENRKHTAPLREQGRISPLMKSTMVGIFKNIGAPAGAQGAKKTTGILAVMLDCADPAREDEFNTWYNDIHVPDVLGTGCYHSATRYVNTGVTPDQPKYLAVYETDRADPLGALDELFGHLADMAKRGRNFDSITRRMIAGFALTYSQADALAAAKATSG